MRNRAISDPQVFSQLQGFRELPPQGNGQNDVLQLFFQVIASLSNCGLIGVLSKSPWKEEAKTDSQPGRPGAPPNNRSWLEIAGATFGQGGGFGKPTQRFSVYH
jgi:hypothetical protein